MFNNSPERVPPPVAPESSASPSTPPPPVAAPWKRRLRQLGWAGVLFFTVKGVLSLTLGAWLIKACSD